MIDVAVIAVVLLLAVPAALWARRASRRMAGALIPARGLVSFDVPPPTIADGPVSLRVVRRPHAEAPIVQQLLDQVTREALDQARLLTWPGVDPAFVQQALEQATATNAATYAAMTAAPVGPRHRRPDGELPPGVLGMTGIMRKLDDAAVAADARMRAAVAAETGELPAVRP